MAFFQRLHRSFRSSRGRRNRQRSEGQGMKLSASCPNVQAAVNSDAGPRPRTPSFASGDTHVADDVVDVSELKGQELAVSSVISPLDAAIISAARQRAAYLPRDVLPDILYGDVGVDSTCHASITSEPHPEVGMKSSVSYCSDLTDLTHVDDGLTDWGLPKVLVPSYDEGVLGDDDHATVASLPLENAPSEFGIDESFFGVDSPLPATIQPQNNVIVKTMSVVYLALLLQRKGVKPSRYQDRSLSTRKSLSQLREEIKEKQIEANLMASFVPVWI